MDRIMEGAGWRITASIIAFFVLVGFLIVWLFFYADFYTVYQNMAVVIVAILAFFGIMGASWASWGARRGMGKKRQHDFPFPSTVPPRKPKKNPAKKPAKKPRK